MTKVVILFVLLLLINCAGTVIAKKPDCKKSACRPGEEFAPEGFGAVSKGGAGGRVIWVTTLEPDGAGSFVEAVNETGPRIIRFKVGGEINISQQKRKSHFIWIGWPHRPEAKKTPGGALNYDSPHSFITIDGTSAPEPGITFINGGFYIGYGVHDVIIRHIRIKHGAVGEASGDGMCIQARQILIDHCMIAGAVDETIDLSSARDVTVQWCILGPRSTVGHPKGFDHSSGMYVSKGATRVSLHHNLIARNRLRNPLLYGDSRLSYEKEVPPICDVVNNTNFECHQGALVGAGMRANLVGNLYLRQHRPSIAIVTKYPGKPKVYTKDNLYLRAGRKWQVKPETSGWWGMPWKPNPFVAAIPFDTVPISTQPVLEAAGLVLAEVGARPWARNEFERELLSEVRKAAGGGMI